MILLLRFQISRPKMIWVPFYWSQTLIPKSDIFTVWYVINLYQFISTKDVRISRAKNTVMYHLTCAHFYPTFRGRSRRLLWLFSRGKWVVKPAQYSSYMVKLDTSYQKSLGSVSNWHLAFRSCNEDISENIDIDLYLFVWLKMNGLDYLIK